MQANAPVDNRALLLQLEQKRDWLSANDGAASSVAIGGAVTSNPTPEKGGAVGASVALKEIQKLNQITRALTAILDAFEDRQEIDVLTSLEVPEQGTLDLLIKFLTAKINFAIALRSQGQARITYREEKEALYRRNKSGGIKPWTPDHVQKLNEQEFWLRKNQNWVFGSSSRQRSRPLIKLLVLTGETRLGQHPEHLYATIGTEKVLLLRQKISVYVLEEKQLIPLIEGFIAQKSQPA